MAVIRSNTKEKLRHYARHAASLSLLCGFIFDYLTLWRIDLFLEDLIFIVYLGVAAVGITYLTLREAEIARGKWADRFHMFFLIALQFTFGGLFGRFFIFYSRSGSLATSWPFLLFLAVLIICNERLRTRYQIFTFRMSVFFVALFSFAIFYIPILMSEISVRVFLLSGGVSLAIMTTFSWGLLRALRGKLKTNPRTLALLIAVIYVAITVMYFANIIPPIPLSLESGGVYHNLYRQGTAFVGVVEPKPWYGKFELSPQIHIVAGNRVYAYGAVFAPTNIKTTVVHEWQFYDTVASKWITMNKSSLAIVGGRDGGYRGFSYRIHPREGRWRVNIQTERGQLIGRVAFTVIWVASEPVLETRVIE